MVKKEFTFSREGKFTMHGAVTIEVEDPNNEEEIKEKLSKQDFKEYLPVYLEYNEDEWDFARTNS